VTAPTVSSTTTSAGECPNKANHQPDREQDAYAKTDPSTDAHTRAPMFCLVTALPATMGLNHCAGHFSDDVVGGSQKRFVTNGFLYIAGLVRRLKHRVEEYLF